MVSEHHAFGGGGAVELAKAVIAACEKPTSFGFLYPVELPIKAKIEVRPCTVHCEMIGGPIRESAKLSRSKPMTSGHFAMHWHNTATSALRIDQRADQAVGFF